MSGQEMEISGNLFGGYNKKQTKPYIDELQTMITELQDSVEELVLENGELQGKLSEAEGLYKALWERCEGQEALLAEKQRQIEERDEKLAGKEEQVRTLSGSLEEQKRQADKKLSKREARLEELEARYDKQQKLIESLLKDKKKKSIEKLEKSMKKQFKKIGRQGKKEDPEASVLQAPWEELSGETEV